MMFVNMLLSLSIRKKFHMTWEGLLAKNICFADGLLNYEIIELKLRIVELDCIYFSYNIIYFYFFENEA